MVRSRSPGADPFRLELAWGSSQPPRDTFSTIVEDLQAGLRRAEITFRPGPTGRFTQAGRPIGRVRTWVPGKRIGIEWQPSPWQSDSPLEMELQVLASGTGSAVRVKMQGMGARSFLEGGPEPSNWGSNALLPTLLRLVSPVGFGDWLTDRMARSPSRHFGTLNTLFPRSP